MLNLDELLRVELKMPGDNIKQYLNDWDTTCANVNSLPDEDVLESMPSTPLVKKL